MSPVVADDTHLFAAVVHDSAYVVGEGAFLYYVAHTFRIAKEEFAITSVAPYLGASSYRFGTPLAGKGSCVHEREPESATGADEVLPHRCGCIV